MKRLLQFGLLSLTLSSSVAYAQPAVLVENFRNVNCGNCRTPDIQFEQWLDENKSNFTADVIYFHNSITYVNDPFYKASQGDVDYRGGGEFYAIGENPHVYVQGLDAGLVLPSWEQFVSGAAAQPKPATVTVSELKATGDNKYSFKVNVTNGSGKQVKLFAALTESGIVYDNTKDYGVPPSGKWDNIFRKMIPDRKGSAEFGASSEQTLTFDLSGKNWDLSKMKAVVFVQDVNKISGNSRLIYGHTVVDLSPLAQSGAVKPISLNGFSLTSLANPFTGSTPLEVRLGQFGHLRVEMYDMTGKKIATVADRAFDEGIYEFNIGSDLMSGTYLVNAFVDGKFAGQVKIVKQ